ncbi:hypothetical protein T069G_00743 [Trichoderma breve]|uniref:Uncharacterized protein n=1 Tax=Trichoderma breve TaxID=2034170 RepID=A0A9W9ECN0_9HYPO|nr:hypothetical protein T069G_00743 [Trichoderma breve]KAJ4864213.1 hypothetical protein T069G_00743 [Trichoderma breve]
MCEKIIQYDCGHMCRRAIRCAEQQLKHRHSVTCFSSLAYAYAYEQNHHETPQFERRATLCPKCEEKGKGGDVYYNSVRRVSAPPIAANQNSMLVQEKEKSTVTKVSASLGRSNSNPERPPSHRLRRVRDAGISSLRNEYNRLEPSLEPHLEKRPESHLEQRLEYRLEPPQNNGFEARRGRAHRPRNIITRGLELDSFASAYVPFRERTPTSPDSFKGLLDYAESTHNVSSLSLGGLRRSTSVLKMLQKGLERKTSDESFVCASAREVEKGERYE